MSRACLNFHGIGTPGRDLEPGEAPYWITEAAYGDILKAAEAARGAVEITYTFDDGNASDLLIGAEGLARHGAKATFFVLSDRLDQPGSLSGADLRALVAAGHRIGLHGAAHVDWRSLDAAGEAREYDTARARLQEAAGAPVTEAAIPFGAYNARVLAALKQRGFTAVWSSDQGRYRNGDWPRPRTSVTETTTGADVTRWLTETPPLLRRLRRRLGRLKKRLV